MLDLEGNWFVSTNTQVAGWGKLQHQACRTFIGEVESCALLAVADDGLVVCAASLVFIIKPAQVDAFAGDCD